MINLALDVTAAASRGFLRSDIKTKAVLVGLAAIGGIYLCSKATETVNKGMEVLSDVGTKAIVVGAVGTLAYFYLSGK